MRDIDELLKVSLSSSDKPSEQLNQELKTKIRLQELEGRTISIWWLPMLMSIFMTIVLSTMTLLCIPYGILQIAIIMLVLLTMTFSIVLTVVGVKCFGLKKGAVISL